MAHNVTMPQLGMTQDSGVILAWLKAVGDPVKVGDALMEVETDKATVEVEATEAGYLVEIRADAGSDIPVGNTVAVISENADDIIAAPASTKETPEPELKATNKNPSDIDIADNPPKAVPAYSQAKTEVQQSGGKILASPKAKVEAKGRGFDLSDLVQQGIQQPIHFKNVLDFKPVAPSALVSPTSHMNEITFTVLRSMMTDFINQLNEQSCKNITVGNLWRMFACGALRSVHSNDEQIDIYSRYSTTGIEPFTCMNADQVLLSAQNAVDDASQVDLSIFDYSTTNVSDLKLITDAAHTALYITNKNKKKLKIKVMTSEQVLSADQMLLFIDELIARLNNPLGYIA